MSYLNTYVNNPLVAANPFIGQQMVRAALPEYDQARELLPRPYWEGHESVIDCYWKTWEIAFSNLRNPTNQNGFIAPYIDTAFNNHLFMWDSAFILLFARYGSRAFDFQQTLDNFYAKQHPDGFICREIRQSDGSDCFYRHDPASTGPNIMPWTEWEYYLNYGDTERLARVFVPLLAYYRWLRTYRTWPDGSYWSSGWGCGMDNQPRVDPERYHLHFSHANQVWVDACLQQICAAQLLLRMSAVLGREDEVGDLRDEIDSLTQYVEEKLWDDADAFYYDLLPDGALSPVKSIGAYWALLAGLPPADRLADFVAHLDNPAEFNRPHRVPTLSADHPAYDAETGNYWNGGVWPPTNYMLLRGLTAAGQDALAHEIARNHLDNVVRVFEETGTVWENYAPEKPAPGSPAKPDFVGWSGLPATAVLLEYAFGLRPSVPDNRLVWDIRLLEPHGVTNYPFGKDGVLSLRCEGRQSPDEEPVIEMSANMHVMLELRWGDQVEVID
jgi:hypothetical protein